MNDLENSWRWTAAPARFLFLDARAAFVFPIFFVHMSTLTLVLVLVSTATFWVLERKRYPVDTAIARIRLLIGSGFKLPTRVHLLDEYLAYRLRKHP